MKLSLFNTGTRGHELIEIPFENMTALTGFSQALQHDLELTVTYPAQGLSWFALRDSVHGEFDFQLFNQDEPVKPYYLAEMLQRFTPERFRRWKRKMSETEAV